MRKVVIHNHYARDAGDPEREVRRAQSHTAYANNAAQGKSANELRQQAAQERKFAEHFAKQAQDPNVSKTTRYTAKLNAEMREGFARAIEKLASSAKDNEKPSPEKIRTLYKSWTSGGQKPSEAIGELADNFGMSEGEIKRIVGR